MLSVLAIACLRVFYVLLLGVSFVSYSIGCCLFLLVGALRFCGFIYLVTGFSWYLVLFCLVYIGGVYVLLVYISMFNSKFFVWFSGGVYFLVFSFFFFILYLGGIYYIGMLELWECSHYICLFEGGFSYGFFCVVLLLGFCLVRLVSSRKDGFFR